MTRTLWLDCVLLIHFSYVIAIELPGFCKLNEYYEPGAMVCQSCPVNASMVSSADGFACSCEEHSVPVTPGRCKPCGGTTVVSTDGMACVPRRCQGAAGRTVCRKCPADYISVTQNFDGSTMKEVLCVKCARGFKPSNNACVRCAACVCARNEVIVRDTCVPRSFVNARPKYEGTMHPFALLDVVKHEYLCIQNDYRACRYLAGECVKNFYTSEAAGPCRLWLQSNLVPHKGLPGLLIESLNDKDPGIDLSRGTVRHLYSQHKIKNALKLALAIHKSSGGFALLRKPSDNVSPCFSFLEITIGNDFSHDCHYNVSDVPLSEGDTLSLYLQSGDSFSPLPVALRKPNGSPVKRTTWPTDKFRRYFFIHKYLSTTSNSTNIIYLRTLLIHLRMQRSASTLRVHLTIEAQYATKPSYARSITTTLNVKHQLPSAGVVRGLEIWGGVLGAVMSCYAVVKWRGVLRRGGQQVAALPLLAGAVADALYFSAWLSTLHALAAEAGSLGLTLPPSRPEERLVRALVYSAVALKAIKVAWVNWCQCRCDIFFLDWSEYNPPVKDELSREDNIWKTKMLAREWSSMQTKRRVSPGITITLSLIVLTLLSPWLDSLPHSPGYSWSAGTVCWWSAYATALLGRWVCDRLVGAPTAVVTRVCDGVGMSLLVFEEENYAHYVHGRAVFKQLSTPGLGALADGDTRQALLSRFLAAFFERALDGLSWVASERTVLERLLDVEIAAREAGNTSALLYDPDDSAPSCFAVTWWGEEWTLATLDAMLFGCVLLATGNWLIGALSTLMVWQVAKQTRTWFGDRNLKQNIGIETIL